MGCMRLEFRSDMRGYVLMLNRDLFGAFILHSRWFGLHNQRGGSKQQVFEDEEDALRTIKHIRSERERHGYRVVAGH